MLPPTVAHLSNLFLFLVHHPLSLLALIIVFYPHIEQSSYTFKVAFLPKYVYASIKKFIAWVNYKDMERHKFVSLVVRN